MHTMMFAGSKRSLFTWLTSGVAAALVASVAVVVAPGAGAASGVLAGVSPVLQQRNPATGVTADGLPTVQIDGVIWSQAIVGNTVYSGGSFATARPAGRRRGRNTVTRKNLLAFDITTGNLKRSMSVPSLNAQVNAVTASPDGSRIYVGGAFTTANGVSRGDCRVLHVNGPIADLVRGIAQCPGERAISATKTTVYVGGNFSTANNIAASHLAAFNASNGALIRSWAPTTDNLVKALVVTPDQSRVIIGGCSKALTGPRR